MGLLPLDCSCTIKPGNLNVVYPTSGWSNEVYGYPNISLPKRNLAFIAFARNKLVKKSIKTEESKKGGIPLERPLDESDGFSDYSPEDDLFRVNSSFDSSESQTAIRIASRSSVLQACTVTSGFIAALGIAIRQVSSFASSEGWPVLDCSSEVSFSFEMWHLELIIALVILISSARFVLLKTWPDFAESSDAANVLVLTSLQLLDYAVVAILPGFSEELLFRGALLPLFGNTWISALAVAALFGFLHLGSGRNYSFVVWAMFVGLVYGYATLLSSSIIVPMASHAANNLIGGILWRYTSNPSK